MEPIEIAAKELAEKPFLAWEALLHIAFDDPDALNDVQLVAHHALHYESEVQNGGHLQFFLNASEEELEPTLRALEALPAPEHAAWLAQACALWRKRARPSIETPEDYVAEAAVGEFSAFDHKFYGAEPSLTQRLEDFLERNQGFFVRVTE